MIYKASADPITGIKEKITKQELRERIEAKLITRGVFDPSSATEEQLYNAELVVKEIKKDLESEE